ncbi:MAG: OsmC family peroxiredoxin [Acidimicrobiia bacterium]|nr:OsmC family peroxiredoxin [Acidimicrobiia bacterium]
MTQPKAPNLLQEAGLPIVYPASEDVLDAPGSNGFAIALRSAVRSLSVMQKEAIVARNGATRTWRLASDEGPYLQGHDFAPAPLAFLSTGLAVDLLASVERSLATAGRRGEAVRLVLDSRYTMEGSLARGTMVGGARPPEITVYMPDATSDTTGLVLTGVMASATAGIVGTPLKSTFTLTSHGHQIDVGTVAADSEPPPSLQDRPERFPQPGSTPPEPIVSKTWDVGSDTADAGSSLAPEQRRELHLQAQAHRRLDDLVVVDVTVHRPRGSTFRFLADEPTDGKAVGNRAPDALTYVSAGIGFCFMTQIGRYAKILQRSLGDYHVSQDTRFSYGDPRANPPEAPRADVPRTHVFLAPDDESFATHALDMSEQTCFIHAMCRTELRPRVKTLALRD